ncbi:hypothetical protein AC249_AIPGENE13093 [Exaiptasia diaphana]|nr:hypothetical protein AC249_AIPGENE13093 [Exaiptasia diaphana]
MGLIAGHVFKYKESEVQQLRTDMKSQVDPHLSLWESVGVEIKGHQLIYLGEPYEPLFSQPLLSSLGAIFRIPLTKKWPGFEVVIQNTGPEYCVAIGVLTTTRVSSQSSGFGGLQADAGFVADRGLIFDMNRITWDDNKECEEYVAKRGDLIGCKVLFDCQSNDGILPMSITLNSRVIGKAEIRPGGKDLFPFVSFGNEGTTVLFKLCPSSEEQFAHTDVLSEEISDLKSEISELRSTMKVLLDALAASKKGN